MTERSAQGPLISGAGEARSDEAPGLRPRPMLTRLNRFVRTTPGRIVAIAIGLVVALPGGGALLGKLLERGADTPQTVGTIETDDGTELEIGIIRRDGEFAAAQARAALPTRIVSVETLDGETSEVHQDSAGAVRAYGFFEPGPYQGPTEGYSAAASHHYTSCEDGASALVNIDYVPEGSNRRTTSVRIEFDDGCRGSLA